MYERVLVPLDGSELAETILPFAERMLGSVAHHLLQAAPCPVLTVGPEDRG